MAFTMDGKGIVRKCMDAFPIPIIPHLTLLSQMWYTIRIMKRTHLPEIIALTIAFSCVTTGCGAAGASIFMNNGDIVNIGDATPQTPETEAEEGEPGDPAQDEGTPEGTAEGSGEGTAEGSGEGSSDPYITGGGISPFYKPEGGYTPDNAADTAPADASDTDPDSVAPESGDTYTGRGDTTGLGGTAAEIISSIPSTISDAVERLDTDIYVSASYGNDDGGNGSYENPFLTVQKALDSVTPGHTVFLMGGTYNGRNTFTNSGGDGRPIVVTAYPGSSVSVGLAPGESGAIFDINGKSNIEIRNLTLGYSYATWVYGVFMHGGEENININNCEFTNLATTATPGAGGAYAVLAYGAGATDRETIRNITVYNNTIHNLYTGYSEAIAASGNVDSVHIDGNTIYEISNIGIDLYGGAGYCSDPALDQPRNCNISGNNVFQCVSPYNACAGIYVSGAKDSVIDGNFVYENAYGIEVASEHNNYYYPTTNITVSNNTVHNNHDSGITIGGTNPVTSGFVTNSFLTGNILYNNGLYINDGANGEIHFEKCDGINVTDNIVRNHDYSNAVIGCGYGMTSEYVKNVKFTNNLYAYDKPAKIVFKFQGNDYIGLENWNKFTGGSDVSEVKNTK